LRDKITRTTLPHFWTTRWAKIQAWLLLH